MELQNCQLIGVREQEHFDKTNNNTLVGASGNLTAFSFLFLFLVYLALLDLSSKG